MEKGNSLYVKQQTEKQRHMRMEKVDQGETNGLDRQGEGV